MQRLDEHQLLRLLAERLDTLPHLALCSFLIERFPGKGERDFARGISPLPERFFPGFRVHPRPDFVVAVDEEAVLISEFLLHRLLELPLKPLRNSEYCVRVIPPLQKLRPPVVIHVRNLHLGPVLVGHGAERVLFHPDVGDVLPVGALHLLPVEHRVRYLLASLLRAKVDLHLLPEDERRLEPDPVLPEEPVQGERVPMLLVLGFVLMLGVPKRHHALNFRAVDSKAVVPYRDREGLRLWVIRHVYRDAPEMPRRYPTNGLDAVFDQFLESDGGRGAVLGGVDHVAHQLRLDRQHDTFLIGGDHDDVALVDQLRHALDRVECSCVEQLRACFHAELQLRPVCEGLESLDPGFG
mmetsp:Transcript_17294/g.41672  ORF Transcript_17294/g.41672 Transcript_17294/m.41672 type:complete len:353 (-) Transcript_17294:123-1181(-)